jgi:hypothetical protein
LRRRQRGRREKGTNHHEQSDQHSSHEPGLHDEGGFQFSPSAKQWANYRPFRGGCQGVVL